MSATPARPFRAACLVLLLAPPAWAGPAVDDRGDPLPPGAVARLGTVRLRHVIRTGWGAACVAFSPDGKTLVSGGDGLIAWDVKTGKNLGWFRTTAPATSARFTADGKAILTVDNRGTVRLWQACTGKLLRERNQHRAADPFLFQETFLAADARLVGGFGIGGGIRLWDAETGKAVLVRGENGRGTWASSAALSPDGKTLAVSGERNRAHLLDVATGGERRVIEGPFKDDDLEEGFGRWEKESVYRFAFSPDGRSLAAVSGKDSFSVWNVADGRRRYTVRGHRGRLAFSPDGKHLLCGGEGAMRLYEAGTGRELRRFESQSRSPNDLAFSPDGKTVAAAHEYAVDLWDVATGRRLHPRFGHEAHVTCLVFSPDGGALSSGDGQGELIGWNLKDSKPRHTLTGHLPGVLSLAYSPDGKVLASGDGYHGSGGFDAQIRLWEPSAGKLLRQFPGHLNGVTSLAFTPDGRRLASAGHDARTRVWDVSTGRRLLQIRGKDSQYRTAAPTPDGKLLLVAGTSGELSLWRTESGRKVRDLFPPGGMATRITWAAFLPDGRVLTCANDEGIAVRDDQDGTPLRSFSLEGRASQPRCLALAPDGRTLAAGGDSVDPTIGLWDTDTGKPVGRLPGHGGGAATALAFSPDGKTLASGGRDTTVLLWDVPRVRFEHLWAELADGQLALSAKGLGVTPEEAIPLLKDHLRRLAATEDRVHRLAADLDDDRFHVREKASRDLEGLGAGVAVYLQRELESSPSLEARIRLRKALARLKAKPGWQDDRPLRVPLAVAIFEEVGTPAARRALEELAKGPTRAEVTREAGAALKRWAKRRH